MKEYDKKNPLKWPITTITGIIAVLFYVVFISISWIIFPTTATPLDHWLSDFGRTWIPAVDKPVWDPATGLIYTGASKINPGGIFYNLACILCGIMLIAFFTGFQIFKNEGKDQKQMKIIKILTYIIMGLGYLAAFSLIMNGIFFEDWPGITQAYYSLEHSFFSKMIFISFLPIMILVGIWTYLLEFKRYITISSFLFLIVAVIVVITGNAIAIAEWIAVFTALALVIMISLGVYLKKLS